MSESVKQICVIGAGAAGLTAIKSCLEEGLEVVCYEKTSDIAGIWSFRSEPPEGVGRVQKTTITNSSNEINGFSDFPYPKEYPNYMHHKKVYQYFQSYAQEFDLIRHILFEHSVLKVEKSDDYDSTHRLKVTVRDQKEDTFDTVFDGVMVCTGHHTRPRMPFFPGKESFKGKIFHSKDMTSLLDFQEYEDKTAVVVGIGNSGCDSAVELRFEEIPFKLKYKSMIFIAIYAIKLIWRYGRVVGFSRESVPTECHSITNSTQDLVIKLETVYPFL